MQKREKNFEVEFFLTVLLLSAVILLLSGVIYTYILYIISGLICGFSFSWFSRGKQFFLISIFTKVATLGIFLWIVYAIINSSLFYSDVILIWIWGVFILETILSFNAGGPLFLGYIQILSIPLLMSYPVLVSDYNRISFLFIAGYILCWLAILKVKFYGFAETDERVISLRNHSIYLLIIFSLICVSVSWIIFSKFHIGMLREGGLLPEDAMVSQGRPGMMEQQYFDLQDSVQKEVASLMASLESTDEKYEILGLLNSLIKESPFIVEVSKAEQGLIDYLQRPGYGLEEKYRQDLTFSIKSYVDKKIAFNLKINKSNIVKVLKRNTFNIKERVSIINLVNNMQRANDHAQLKKSVKDFNNMLDKSGMNTVSKGQLKEFANQMRGWKELQIYRQLSDDLKKKIDSSAGESKKELENLQSEIEKTENSADFKKMDEKAAKLKETNLDLTSDLEKSIDRLSDSKLEVMLSEKNRELKDKLKSPDSPEDRLKGTSGEGQGKYEKQYLPGKYHGEVRVYEGCVAVAPYDERGAIAEKEVIICAQEHLSVERVIEKPQLMYGTDYSHPFKEVDDIRDIENSQDFLERSSEFQEMVKENEPDANEQTREFLETKNYSLIKGKLKEINELLKKSVLSVDSAMQFFKQLGKMVSDKEIKDLTADSKKLEADIASFSNQGFILKETQVVLTKEIEDIKDLLLRELTIDEQAQDKRPLKNKNPNDFQKEWEELLQKTPLREERKDALRRLHDELLEAKTVSQIENIKDAVRKEMAEALKEGMYEQEKNRLEQRFLELASVQRMFTLENGLFDLREEIEQFKQTNPEEAKRLEKLLKKVKEGSSNEQIEAAVDSIKQDLESDSKDWIDKQQSKDKESRIEGLSVSLEIYILPSYLIIPLGTHAPLKAIAIYNKKFIKELDSDLEWSCSDTSVAVVDKKGFVKALSKGRAKISVDYKGISSQEIEVIAAQKLSEDKDRAIKNELGQ